MWIGLFYCSGGGTSKKNMIYECFVVVVVMVIIKLIENTICLFVAIL